MFFPATAGTSSTQAYDPHFHKLYMNLCLYIFETIYAMFRRTLRLSTQNFAVLFISLIYIMYPNITMVFILSPQ